MRLLETERASQENIRKHRRMLVAQSQAWGNRLENFVPYAMCHLRAHCSDQSMCLTTKSTWIQFPKERCHRLCSLTIWPQSQKSKDGHHLLMSKALRTDFISYLVRKSDSLRPGTPLSMDMHSATVPCQQTAHAWMSAFPVGTIISLFIGLSTTEKEWSFETIMPTKVWVFSFFCQKQVCSCWFPLIPPPTALVIVTSCNRATAAGRMVPRTHKKAFRFFLPLSQKQSG